MTYLMTRAFFVAALFSMLMPSLMIAQDSADEGPKDGVLSVDRAWDYRPYRVRVWICTDGSAEINANYSKLVSGLTRRSELADPSGWELLVSRAPNPWAFRFPQVLETAEQSVSIGQLPDLKQDDKLMIVCLSSKGGLIHCRVREFDILTEQWSALVQREIANATQLDATVYDLVATAFMPLARIDRVDRANNVFMRARAVNVCQRAQMNADGDWEVVPNSGSPVWVRDDDRFLPIIRRTDRSGNPAKLEPIEFTFLTITSLEGPDVEAKIQSTARAPLAGRTSKRAQKLALVIRPPAETTTLTFVSRDDETHPLEGFEVFSRPVGAAKTDPSEFLGITDWRGSVEIPPSDEGLRIVLVKRGTRPLKKLPIMPGLYKNLVTTLPNDEARLNAEGIIKGMESEILNLVAQREIYESQIAFALDNNNYDLATDLLDQYRQLPTLEQVRARMTDDETRLKSQATEKREMDYINKMFSSLRQIIGGTVSESKATELLQRIQQASEQASQN